MLGQNPPTYRSSTTAERFPLRTKRPGDELAALAAAENTGRISLVATCSPPAELCLGCNNFDLDQELWPEELGNNEEHRGRTRVAEEPR